MWWIWIFLLVVALAITLFAVIRKRGAPEPPEESIATDESAGTAKVLHHTPHRGESGESLEVMKAAVAVMPTDEIENLLEMGATLKPGAEEVFRRELERRNRED